MTGLLLAAALLGAAAAGYVLGRVRPSQRVSDWAEWEKYGHPTGLRRTAMRIVLTVDVIAWAIPHPRQAREAWKHRNDPPPPRSPAPVLDPNWPANRTAAQEGQQQP